MRGTRQQRRLGALGLRNTEAAGLVVLVVLWLASAAAAMPPDLTDDFDSGDAGWSLYEGGAIGPADWLATGGNPGGYISHKSSGAETDAAFGDAGYVAHLSRYFDKARIVADMRSTATAATPTVRLADPDYSSFGSISSTAAEPMSGAWRHYSFPLRASAGWYDDSGHRLDSGRLRRFLALDPIILVDAGYGAGETTDLDNIGLSTVFPRGVSIRAKAGRKGFKGAITIKQGRDAPQCLAGQKVRILRTSKGKTGRFAAATTNDAGKYSVAKGLKPGRYFAQAPESAPPASAKCGEATSKTIRVKR